MIFNFYIFDRHCECVYYIEFQNRANFTATGGLKSGSTIDYFVWPDPNKQFQEPTNSLTLDSLSFSSSNYYFPPGFSEPDFLEKNKLVYGVVFSLKTFVTKLAGPLEDGFLSFSTGHYKLHYFETLTGLRFIITTSPSIPNLKDALRHIFDTIYVENVLKNPLSLQNASLSDEPITSNEDLSSGHNWIFNNRLFTQNLVKYLSQITSIN